MTVANKTIIKIIKIFFDLSLVLNKFRCSNEPIIGIKLKIKIWFAVMSWLNKKASTDSKKVTFNIFIIRLFFLKFFIAKKIKGNNKKCINLKSPNSLFKFIWFTRLTYAVSLLEILPSPMVKGNKIYWYKKLLKGVCVTNKNPKNSKMEIVHPKTKNFNGS